MFLNVYVTTRILFTEALCLARSKKLLLSSTQVYVKRYGFVLNYPSPDIIGNEEFEGLKVFWKPEGIELETIWDVRLFIPKQRFVGGR